MIFNICYKNRENVLLSVNVYIQSEDLCFNYNDSSIELNTKIIGTGITRYVFDTIKDDTSLRVFQNKLLPLQELRGLLHSSEFNHNLYTTLEEASIRNTSVIKAVREKLNEFCDFFGEDLYINED